MSEVAKVPEAAVKPEPKPAATKPAVTKKAAKKAPKPGRRPHPGRRGFGAAKRTRVVEKFRALIDSGASRREAAKAVKFADLTLRRWETSMGLKPASSRGKGGDKKAKAKVTTARKPGRPKGKVAKKRGRPRGRPASKPVGRPRARPRKTPAAVHPAGGLVLVSPSGLRLEGIRTSDLLRVLRTVK
ncbi:MAG TPA: hypothetical protein PK668_21750 [Myxococcota bacterium]|nr:hypothetical protein [Myxococcota bacterium]HRY96103.1 hypothetical protein [Myxococcota bacterium]